MLQKFARIQDRPNLVRDTSTQAILPIDTTIVKKHEKRMKDLQKEENRDKILDFIQNQIFEMRTMMTELMAKSKTSE